MTIDQAEKILARPAVDGDVPQTQAREFLEKLNEGKDLYRLCHKEHALGCGCWHLAFWNEPAMLRIDLECAYYDWIEGSPVCPNDQARAAASGRLK